MDQAPHNKIVSFIWGIADDVLRDLFKRGKYRDVILPMCVLRRLDAVLEPTKKSVLETKDVLEKAGITEQRAALCGAAGQAFYNTSKYTLRDLKPRASQPKPAAAFRADPPARPRGPRLRLVAGLRRRPRHRRHAHGRRRNPQGARRQTWQASRRAPLRPGNQPRDLRHLQGRHAAQG